MPRKIEISHKTIVFTIITLISLWLVYQIKDIILGFFVAPIAQDNYYDAECQINCVYRIPDKRHPLSPPSTLLYKKSIQCFFKNVRMPVTSRIG